MKNRIAEALRRYHDTMRRLGYEPEPGEATTENHLRNFRRLLRLYMQAGGQDVEMFVGVLLDVCRTLLEMEASHGNQNDNG